MIAIALGSKSTIGAEEEGEERELEDGRETERHGQGHAEPPEHRTPNYDDNKYPLINITTTQRETMGTHAVVAPCATHNF